MVFSEYLQSLSNERTDLIKTIAEKTCSSTSIVYRWISGQIVPGPLKQRIISEIIGIPQEELFPDSNRNGNGAD